MARAPEPSDAGARGDVDETFAEFARLPEGDARRRELREKLVSQYLPVARHIAKRFAHRGQSDEDLRQVALLGLVNAINRFDPLRGTDFLAFAVPTMMGEVRRYFRDYTWAVRVPRRLQVLHLSVNNAISELSQELGRAPTASQVAGHLGVPVGQVHEALEASNAYRAASLDSLLLDDDEMISLGDTLGEEDTDIRSVEQHEALRPLLDELPERERRILTLRFFGNMSQTQIAAEVGISQMHVSRLLSKTLARLRQQLLAGS